MHIPTPPVRCPIEGHDRGWWAWGPWFATLVIAVLATVFSLIPWQVAASIFFVVGCVGVGVSYFHVVCHLSPNSRLAGGTRASKKDDPTAPTESSPDE